MPVYKLEWDESRIVREFIPNLLHGWNINIDSASEKNWRFLSVNRSVHLITRLQRKAGICLTLP